MYKYLKSLTFLFLLLSLSLSTFATHLMGGSMGYEYIGPVGGNLVRYKIKLHTYTNCDASSMIPFPEDPLRVGVYHHNSANPNADKQFLTSIQIDLKSTQTIKPDNPNNCTVGQGSCIIEGYYEGFVNVPMSLHGYHLFYERCCRNAGINNLLSPGTQSNAFYAFIPPTLIANSTPVFTNLPTSFLCVGDLVSILNTATDPDGDQLIFSFVVPYNGFATSGAPAPPPPTPVLNWPIPEIVYSAGHNVNEPFGVAGHAQINAMTGFTSYMAPAIGKYVVAIEVKEYRNGNLIGITRRDLQMNSIFCPPNPPPTLPANGQTSYSIEAGQNFCVPITFNDANNDSLTLTASGSIFNSSIVNPPATITTPVKGLGTVTTNFCWQTTCSQSRTQPYTFNVSVKDNGCPPKTTNEVFSITVNPPQAPSAITGPVNVCTGINEVYSTTQITGHTYNWTVTGGTIVSGGNNNSITVSWHTPGTGQLSVSSLSTHGCPSAPVTLNVTVFNAPQANAGPDQIICSGNSVQIGNPPVPGFTYSWTPAAGLSNPNIANPVASPTITTQYILTASNGSSCPAKDTVIVQVGAGSANAGPDVAICIGESTQLNASGGLSYSWAPAAGLSNPNIANPVASPVVTTNYVVTVTDNINCTYTDTVTVTVNNLPLVNAGNNATICSGTTITLGGSPTGPAGSTYSWSPAGTLNNPAIANPVASPQANTTYTIEVTSAQGCKSNGSVTIIVIQSPTAVAGSDQEMCFGDSVQISASGGVSYNWQPASGLSNPGIANPKASPAITTNYIVTVTNADGCSSKDSLIVTVNQLPLADAGPDEWLCPGDNTTLQATGGISYSWSPSGGLSNVNIANPVANPAVSTKYFVTVTDAKGCVNIDSLIVTVNNKVPTSAGPPVSICVGDTVTIGGNPTAPNKTTYNWLPAAGLDNPAAANPRAFPSVTTKYYVYTSNDTCSGLDSVMVFVHPAANANAGPDLAVCLGDSIQLSGSGGVSFEWSPASGLDDPSIPNPFAGPATTTTYTLTVTDVNGCKATDTMILTVNTLPNAKAGGDVAVCFNDSVKLNASGGTSYSWSPATGLSNPNVADPKASPSDTTKYYVTVTDNNSCKNIDSLIVVVHALPKANAGADGSICIGDSTQVVASGGTKYLWTAAPGMGNLKIANPWVSPTVTTTYVVTVTDANGCEGIDSVKISVNALPNAVAGPDVSVCAGDSVKLTASGGIFYSWTPATGLSNDAVADPWAKPVTSTKYYVLITDQNNCSNTDSLEVFVNPLPVIDAGQDQTNCKGDSVTLNATGGVLYTWTPANAISNPSVASPKVSPAVTTIYTVTGTDANGCSAKDSVTVSVFRISLSADTTICSGDTVRLRVDGLNASSYQWSPSNSLLNSNSATPLAFPDVTTKYTVSVSDGSCADEAVVTVFVKRNPLADFSVEYKGDCKGVMAEFTNQSQDADSYLWNFGNGNTSTDYHSRYVFPGSAILKVSLTAFKEGCRDTKTMEAEVKDFDFNKIEIPNVFTPNNDGMNDFFHVHVSEHLSECINMKIFSRWGTLIYEFKGITNIMWDGRTFTGVKASPGTYYYILELNGIQHKGNVTLLE